MRGLARGRYIATFELEADGADGATFGRVDVASDKGETVHAETPVLRSGRQQLELPFELDTATSPLEYRVFSSGAGRLTMHGVRVRRQPTT